jgi:hypothetical protein
VKDVVIKQHDTKAIFTDALRVNGVAVDLTNATITFVMRGVGGVGIEQTAAITNPPGSDGQVNYVPVASDVSVAADYKQQWRVHFSDGKYLTFPNNGYNRVTILPDLV